MFWMFKRLVYSCRVLGNRRINWWYLFLLKILRFLHYNIKYLIKRSVENQLWHYMGWRLTLVSTSNRSCTNYKIMKVLTYLWAADWTCNLPVVNSFTERHVCSCSRGASLWSSGEPYILNWIRTNKNRTYHSLKCRPLSWRETGRTSWPEVASCSSQLTRQ